MEILIRETTAKAEIPEYSSGITNQGGNRG